MRKFPLFVFLLSAFLCGNVFAVGVTTNGSSGLSASYPDLASAITALNAATITSPVVITCSASGTETAPAGGYSITVSGTSSNTITIDGNSSTITAFTPQTSGNLNDAIFKLIGADYITLKNFTMQENASNSTTTTASNNMTEFGVALFYSSLTNGSQNNTIQNNTISLNRTYTNTFGIYSNTRHSATAMTTSAEVTSSAGANSFNKIYTNSISNVNYGIVFIGAGTTIAAIDNGNDIGGTSVGTGNTITNWGGSAAATGYISLTGNNYCIFDNQQINENVSYNTITSASLTSAVTEGGVLKNYSVASPTSGTITSTLNNNTVQITNNPTAVGGSIVGVNSQGLTPLLSTATINMQNNVVQNCTLGGSTVTTGGITAVTNLSLPGTLNIVGNSIIGNSLTGSAATTSSFTGISNSGAAGTVWIRGNIIRGLTITTNASYTGGFLGISNSGAVTTALNINSNQLGNASGGAFQITLAAGASINNGIQNTAGASGCTLRIDSNYFRGWTMVSSTSSSTAILNTNGFVGGNISISNDSIGTTAGNFATFSAASSGGINGISNQGGSSTSILTMAYNDIRGITHTTQGSATHGYISNSFATLSQFIYKNSFTNLNVNTTGSVTFISNSVTVPANGTQVIDTNSIVTAFNKGGAGGTVTCMTSAASTVLSTVTVRHNNNNFSNITVTGATALNGISNTDGTGSIAFGRTVNGNKFNNWTGGSSAITVMAYSYWGGTTGTLSGDTITNITGTGAITAVNIGSSGNAANPLTLNGNLINNISSTGTGGAVTGIVCSNTSTSITFSNNIINTLSSTAGAAVTGISISGAATTVNVNKNKIYDLSGSSASSTVFGLALSAGVGTANIYNNIIGDLKATSATSGSAIYGINLTGTTTSTSINVYYNSIYITGTGGSGFGSAGIFHTTSATATTAALTLRNNNIVNTATVNGSGLHVAYRRSSSTLTNYTASSNNNNFYGTSALYYDGTTAQTTLSGYKSTMSTRDQISYNENPTFQSTTSSNANFLKYSTSVASQLESGGVGIGTAPYPAPYNVDYGGTTRQGSTGYAGTGTAPDVGAWELEGIPSDQTGPTISYTALANAAAGVNQTLTATITDASGIGTGAGLPALYYKLNSGSWSAAVMGVSIGSNQYTFTFGSSASGGDVVSYYVAAQDGATSPNVSTFPVAGSSGFTTNPPAASTPPTTPSTYTALGTLSGTKTVGTTGRDYATLKAAFDDINAKVLTGNLTLDVQAEGTTESAAAVLNQIAYSGGTYTLTIKPNSTATITGAIASNGIIKLNGADNVVIDGSNSGGTDKSLTITNSSTTAPTGVFIASLGTGTGATNNTVKNCNISTGVSTVSQSYGISVGKTSPGTAGEDNDNITLQNNTITGATVGISVLGTASSSTGGDDALAVTGNTITTNTTLATTGIQVGNALTSSVSQNTLSVQTSGGFAPVGISLETGFVSSTVTRNTISNALATNTGGYGGRGITVGTGTSSSSLTIANNIIYGVNGSNWTGFGNSSAMGIAIGMIGNSSTITTTAGSINLYYNSVYLSGSYSSTSACLTAAVYIGSNAATLDIRNNIFVNTLNNSGTGTSSKAYSIYSAAANTAFSNINYNDYYVSGTQSVLGFLSSDRTNLLGIQNGFGGNANSTISDPLFTSTTDLHISQSGAAYHTGVTGLSVTTDFTGATRNNPPSMGAYDAGVNAGPIISYTPLSNGLASNNQVLTASISDANDGVPQSGIGLPTLYYKSTTSVATYTAVQAVYVSGNNYTFTFGASVTGTGETVSYYIVAQDNAGLLTCSPSAGSAGLTADPPKAGTPPSSPSTYTTVGSFSGTYTVGTGGTYATLSAACTALNAGVLAGDVTLSLLSGTTETSAATLNNQAYSGAAHWNITIKPASGVTATVSSNQATPILLNGADYVIIDGSNNGTTSRDMTITTSSSSTAGGVVWMQTAASGNGTSATNNTVKNCNITGNSNITTLFGIGSGGTTISITSTGTSNNTNTIQNNNIAKVQYGIYSSGASAGNKNTGTVITQNLMNTASPNNIQTAGIYVAFDDGVSITQNTIGSIDKAGGTQTGNAAGIALGLIPNNTSTVFTGSDVINATVSRNLINGITTTNSTGYGTFGIIVNTVTSGTTNVTNNVVSGILSPSTPSDISAGILLGAGSGSTSNCYFNSVYLSGARGAATTSSLCLAIAADNTVNVKNNIFSNTQTSSSTGKSYSVGTINTTFTNLTSDYNDLYTTAAPLCVTGGFTGGTDRNVLSNWQTTIGNKDANSKSADPLFASTSDLSYSTVTTSTTVIPTLNTGVTGTGVTTDYTGAARSTTNPDMGAYEFTSTLNLSGSTGTVTLPGGSYSGFSCGDGTHSPILSFSSAVTITGTLNLSNGRIDMNGNTLTIGTSTASTGALNYTGGSINGTLKRWFSASTTDSTCFPIDNGSGTHDFVAVYLSFKSAPTTGGTLTASYHSSGSGQLPNQGNGFYIPATQLGVNFINLAPQYWTVTAADGLAGGSYDIHFIANNMNVSSTNYQYTGIVKRSDNSQPWAWDYNHHSQTTSPSAIPTFHGYGFTSFSDFGVAGNVDNLLPVEFSTFTASIDRRNVTLNWTTATEQNNAGFDIERRKANTEEWGKIGNIKGNGTSNVPHNYKYEDRNLLTGKYNYRLKQMDLNGNFKYYTLTALVEVGIPTKYDMSQNYPNPFNPTTKINYDLPFDSKVAIRIFDMTGREMGTVVNTTQTAGYYTAQFNASNFASGTYFYNIIAEGSNGNKFINTKKMVLVK